MILAQSMDQAERDAKEMVFERYPDSDGWSFQSVVIAPVEEAFFRTLDALAGANLLVKEQDPLEKTQTIHYK